MMPRAATRLGRVKKLARAGMWIAMGAAVTLPSISSGWTFVASGCTFALAAPSRSAATCCRHPGWR